MDMKNNGILLVLMTAIVSGFSIFLNSFAVKGFDSAVFTFAKNIVVAVLLLSIILLLKEHKSLRKLSSSQWKQLLLIGLIGGAIPFLMFFKGLQLSTGSTSSFIHKTLFIFASLMAFLILKEKLNKKTLIGAGAILIGTYLMIMPEFQFTAGHLLVIGAVLFWSFENVLSKRLLKDVSGNIVAWGRMFFGALFILVYLFFTGKSGMVFAMDSSQYIWIAITSVLLLLYVITYYNGLKHLSVTTATAILTLGAPITVLLSWIYGIGQISLYESIGMLVIILGVVVIAWNSTVTNWLHASRT